MTSQSGRTNQADTITEARREVPCRECAGYGVDLDGRTCVPCWGTGQETDKDIR